ncbi:hypothetical protein [Mycolicibacterium aubagnense]|uniref:Uncharacterized protein n=1 Tax=Mycolicibacterium aubagnense TaxID=319707 RepID=A0ABM7IMD9_9MYCO|nr:hypothetical protein [Mycolicibacterium aubagnense]TLH48569.1 hypothetical protein C1S80_29765 [Mycolicibacterium aubagnense]BBX87973.1 hypothetical protein MAUB_58460 [Mycolicibacterium aubagnense]
MSEWKLQHVTGTRTTYARELEGLDRIVAYVDFDQWEDESTPPFYEWSVQDSSCGKVFEQDYVDGTVGLEAAKRAADNAAGRLFPGR